MFPILSEFFINIGAGLFAAAFISPQLSTIDDRRKSVITLFNITAMIFSLVISYQLKLFS
ncbi:hypothetical protein A2957_00880 [Candidatus Roizmanbacteria bacterium RIFCSPLOWO2_01_FULL_38_11]|uniref:Uncharacterized protein n=1 Tax=Candidatus Roizmanbacteria bacterium RIFCSPLOWO2_01_FULL_38_11 TaxID=1802060 RepID=A0A1F7IM18_9BACT|nr:MAG: hypothetical protein A2957_00880 [Candidatus Roizmanbacteria bacterium RIFCSPLOWO2_01_FULL_38_11]